MSKNFVPRIFALYAHAQSCVFDDELVHSELVEHDRLGRCWRYVKLHGVLHRAVSLRFGLDYNTRLEVVCGAGWFWK